MRFGNIDLPLQLIESARNNKLIVFVGAGASQQCDPPLPSFEELVDRIRKKADPYRQFELPEEVSPERKLGILDDHTHRVKECCADLLGTPITSNLHKSILGIFQNEDDIRIVSTNFDKCFKVAADELNLHPSFYYAPALPRGRSFKGIVHLHGSTKEPASQVLTDTDFGEAYVSSGWASRFLTEAFASYTVLFIGFSGNDTMFKYLARSLSSDMEGSWFALSRKGSNDYWKEYSVEVIEYDDHVDLPEALDLFADHLSASLLDRKRRVRSIASCGATMSMEDDQFLEEIFANTNTEEHDALITAFCEEAKDSEFLSWLNSKHQTDFLFSHSNSPKWQREMQTWVTNRLELNAWRKLASIKQSAHNRFSPFLLEEALHRITRDETSVDAAFFWLAQIDQDYPFDSNALMQLSLSEYVSSCNNPQLFRIAAKMMVQISPELAADGIFSGEKKLKSKFRYRGFTGIDLFPEGLSHLPSAKVRYIFDLCIAEIEKAYVIESEGRAEFDGLDVISYRRGSIEESDQNYFSDEPVNALIKVARDAGEDLVRQKMGDDCIDRCLNSNRAILVRLGLHLQRFLDREADAIILGFIDGNFISVLELWHECCSLLRDLYPKLTQNIKYLLLEHLAKSCPSNERRVAVLSHIETAAPNDSVLVEELAPFRNEHRYSDDRMRPDYLMYTTCGWVKVEDESDITEDSFTYEQMRAKVYAPPPRGKCTTGEAMIQYSAKIWPAEALSMLGKCFDTYDEADAKLASALSSGLDWPTAFEINPKECLLLLGRMTEKDSLQSITIRSIEKVLESERASKTTTLATAGALVALAFDNWELTLAAESPMKIDNSTDWLTLGINHPAGIATSMLIRYISDLEQEGSEQIFAERFSSNLQKIYQGLSSGNACSGAIAAVIAVDLNYLIRVLPGFSKTALQIMFVRGSICEKASWCGLSYNNTISKALWLCLEGHFDGYFSSTPIPTPEKTKRIASLYIWAAITHGDKQKRKERFVRCALSSSGSCTSALNQVKGWLEHICEDARLEEWEQWVEPSLAEIIARNNELRPAVGSVLLRCLPLLAGIRHEVTAFLVDEVKAFDLASHRPLDCERLMTCEDVPIEYRARLLTMILRSECFYLPNGTVEKAVRAMPLSKCDPEVRFALEEELALNNFENALNYS